MIGCFFSLALLFDGLGLIATGFGGRRIVGIVSEQLTRRTGRQTRPPTRTTAE